MPQDTPVDVPRVPPRRISRCGAWGIVVATLLSARPASAQDPPPNKVAVTVTPKGQTWSVGDRGGAPCDPTCTLFLAPDSYLVRMNEVKQTVFIQVPTELTYDPGAPRLRTIGGWTAVGGVGVGAILLGFGAYGLLQECAHTGSCAGGLTVTRPVAEGLIFTAGALLTIPVAGGIVFAVTADGIGVKELAPAPEPRRRKGFDVMFRPSTRGGTIGLATLF